MNSRAKPKKKKKSKSRSKRKVRVQWMKGAKLEQVKEAPPNYKTEGERRAAFLGVLAQTGNVSRASEISGFPRTNAYRAREEDEVFRKQWAEAERLGIEALEDEARRRAQLGVDEPVFQGGRQVGTIKKFSDTLTIFLLKGAKPEKYRDNVNIKSINRNVNANVPVDTNNPQAAADAYRRLMNGEDDDSDEGKNDD